MKLRDYLAIHKLAETCNLKDKSDRISFAKIRGLVQDFEDLRLNTGLSLNEEVNIKGKKGTFFVIGFVPTCDLETEMVSFGEIDVTNADGEYFCVSLKDVKKLKV